LAAEFSRVGAGRTRPSPGDQAGSVGQPGEPSGQLGAQSARDAVPDHTPTDGSTDDDADPSGAVLTGADVEDYVTARHAAAAP
jgi:hypothetical protein